MAIIQKDRYNNNECTLLVGIKIGTAILENNMEVLQKKKVKMKLKYDPAIPLLSIYKRETKSLFQRDIH